MADPFEAELLKTQDIIGKPVISLQGEEIGSVAKVIVNPTGSGVVALTVNIKGLFKGEKAVELTGVNAIGEYAVTVQNSGQILPLDELPAIDKLSKEHNMYNMRIVTPDGKLIGTVNDFYFNVKTGTIERYVLTGGIIKNLFKGHARIPASSIEQIGKDLLIAKSNVEEFIEKEDNGLQDSFGNIKGDIGQWKEDIGQWKGDFEKAWEKTRVRAVELSKSVGDNIKEAARSSKDRGQELLTKTGDILTEKTGQLKASSDWWMDRLQAVTKGPEKPLQPHDVNVLIGLKAGKTVFDNEGNIIINEDEEVTKQVIDLAQTAGKTKELLISVATRDLEDKIKSIENVPE